MRADSGVEHPLGWNKARVDATSPDKGLQAFSQSGRISVLARRWRGKGGRGNAGNAGVEMGRCESFGEARVFDFMCFKRKKKTEGFLMSSKNGGGGKQSAWPANRVGGKRGKMLDKGINPSPSL